MSINSERLTLHNEKLDKALETANNFPLQEDLVNLLTEQDEKIQRIEEQIANTIISNKQLQEKTVTPDTEPIEVVPDNGYYLSKVTVEGIDPADSIWESFSITYDLEYNLPIPQKKGYTFQYWELNNSSFALYGVYTIPSNIALKAIYTPNIYSIYLCNGYSGDSLISYQTLAAPYNQTLQFDLPLRKGYIFDHWSITYIENGKRVYGCDNSR